MAVDVAEQWPVGILNTQDAHLPCFLLPPSFHQPAPRLAPARWYMAKNIAISPPLPPHVRRPGERMSKAERRQAQETFLAEYAEGASIRAAAAKAMIDRRLVDEWKDADEGFAQRFFEAEKDAQDRWHEELVRRAVQGVWEPLVQGGRWVHEEIPDIDEKTGKQKQDDSGAPIFKRGKPLWTHKYSDGLLRTLVTTRHPAYRDKKTMVEISGPGGGNIPINGVEVRQDAAYFLQIASIMQQLGLLPPAAGPVVDALHEGSSNE